ncbi:gliding motility-associated ABC transporter ATP-binding subunit GldA [Flavobacterium sp.]|uniref:gliding motility-associated ABC transporter ATP-binding subunit GldA n=1 Tax=Flavobacterium sp. TaxID=239 RepID=UPI002FDB4B7B
MSIFVKNITKNYGTQKALDNVSFEVKSGEIVGFLGPNGAGKSTLMKILTTYTQADNGDAKIAGIDVKMNPKEVRKIVGYLPEHNPLYLDFYVREYLNYNAEIYKIDIKRVDEVIALTGLTPESHKKIGQLSKGYRQRVGLAAALLHNPQVLILDEPTTGLDPNQLAEIREVIKNIGRDKTVFLSTHIMQEVEAICDRVLIINHGKIITDKTLNKLIQEEQEQLLEVEFDKPVTSELINTLVNLKEAKAISEHIWELTFVSNEDMRSHLFDFATANGLKTLQLHLKSKKLEQIFREKTSK